MAESLHGVDALEALCAAIEAAEAPRESWMPRDADDRRRFVESALAGTKPAVNVPTVPHVGYSGAAEGLTALTLRTLPGVEVLATGTSTYFGCPATLFEYQGRRWVAVSDQSGTLLNPGECWPELVATGKVIA